MKRKVASDAWKKEFSDRREQFIMTLRDAVKDRNIVSRVVEDAGKYGIFSKWCDGEIAIQSHGTLDDAEGFLRHLIDHGHKVAFAVNRKRSIVLVACDGDQNNWIPVWPEGFDLDIVQISKPMTIW